MAKGEVTALGQTLSVGDAMVVTHPGAIKLEGKGLVVAARTDLDPAPCAAEKAPVEARVVPGGSASELRWAGGAMTARLDVGTTISPGLYLGRLAGTASVAEHNHPTSWEILAALEADGTFVLEGREAHLGPRQIVFVPPGAKHSWRPAPGSRLVAIQMYSPPGPEQRFVALAAAERDAGRDAP